MASQRRRRRRAGHVAADVDGRLAVDHAPCPRAAPGAATGRAGSRTISVRFGQVAAADARRAARRSRGALGSPTTAISQRAVGVEVDRGEQVGEAERLRAHRLGEQRAGRPRRARGSRRGRGSAYRRSRVSAATELPDGIEPSKAGLLRTISASWSSLVKKKPPARRRPRSARISASDQRAPRRRGGGGPASPRRRRAARRRRRRSRRGSR